MCLNQSSYFCLKTQLLWTLVVKAHPMICHVYCHVNCRCSQCKHHRCHSRHRRTWVHIKAWTRTKETWMVHNPHTCPMTPDRRHQACQIQTPHRDTKVIQKWRTGLWKLNFSFVLGSYIVTVVNIRTSVFYYESVLKWMRESSRVAD